jgi:hypothetical protein
LFAHRRYGLKVVFFLFLWKVDNMAETDELMNMFSLQDAKTGSTTVRPPGSRQRAGGGSQAWSKASVNQGAIVLLMK